MGIETRYRRGTILSLLLFFVVSAAAVPCRADDLSDCMLTMMHQAEDHMTIGQLRLTCQEAIATGHRDEISGQPELPVVSERRHEEDEHALAPFTLMAHKPNYLLFASYNSSGYSSDHFKDEFSDPDYTLDDVEAKFQLSIKFPLLLDIFDTVDLYAAYTNRSFWQIYNSTESAPFRETNHEPEIWLQFRPEWKLFGFTNSWNSVGLNHQSNGRDGTLSRSWNRVFAWITFERDNLAISMKPWYAIVDKSHDADNADITDYLGHSELSAAYKWNEHVFSVMSRNNLESGFKRGAVELSWSFPLGSWPYMKGYVRYFNGYGESLIDYNQHVNTFGMGLSLTDWL